MDIIDSDVALLQIEDRMVRCIRDMSIEQLTELVNYVVFAINPNCLKETDPTGLLWMFNENGRWPIMTGVHLTLFNRAVRRVLGLPMLGQTDVPKVTLL